MTIRFDGQVAVVTGSGRGLGAAYAKVLAERGAYVLIHDAGVTLNGRGADPEVADAMVHTITSTGGAAVPCYENIESRAGCQRVIEIALQAFGRLDILIHNAGWITYTPVVEMTPELLERILKVQIEAPFWLSQAAFPIMQRQRYGRIVFTTSGRAMFQKDALSELSGYAIGKMGQLGLMNVLATMGKDFNIRVNAISPVAATRMLRRPVGSQEMRPEQVAPGVVFLASSSCTFSGAILQAGNGKFAAARVVSSPGVDFGIEATTPEAIAERWDSITGA